MVGGSPNKATSPQLLPSVHSSDASHQTGSAKRRKLSARFSGQKIVPTEKLVSTESYFVSLAMSYTVSLQSSLHSPHAHKDPQKLYRASHTRLIGLVHSQCDFKVLMAI